MHFYTAIDRATGRTIWGRRKDAAARLDKDFERHEIEISQDALISRFQAYEDRISELEIRCRSIDAHDEADVAPQAREMALPGAADEPAIMRLDADRLAPFVDQAIERFGELGEQGFIALDAYHAGHGISGSFSRGVHMLSVLCTGEHQLTRLLFRSRSQFRSQG